MRDPVLMGGSYAVAYGEFLTALFDVFTDPTGTKLAADRKSLAWTLTYRAPDKTLETAEVDATHNRIVSALEKALPVVVRK